MKRGWLRALAITTGLVASPLWALQHDRVSVLHAQDKWTPQDVEAELFFGRNLAAKMLGQYPLYADDQVQGYVNYLGSMLARYSARPDLSYYFGVIDSDKLNAFATPGGYIFITTGALMQCENESELAGILAHEIGHVTQRHIVKQLNIRGKKADDFSGFMSAVVSGGSQSATSAFKLAIDGALDVWHGAGLKSREDEFEADTVATQILQKAGYPVEGFAQFLARASQLKTEVSDRVRTHPPFKDRVERIRAKVHSLQTDTTIGQQRFEQGLYALLIEKKDKTNILRQLADSPIVADAAFQKYLNTLAMATMASAGLSDTIVVAVDSPDVFYQPYTRFSLISTGLLNRLQSEAEFAGLVLFNGLQSNSIASVTELDYQVAALLSGMGFPASVWGNLLQRDVFFKDGVSRGQVLKKDFTAEGKFALSSGRQTVWQMALTDMNQVRDANGIHPLLHWLPWEKDQNTVRYLNLLSFALVKQLKDARIPVTLKGVFVVNDRFSYVRLQDEYLIISQGKALLNDDEDQMVAMILNRLLLSHGKASQLASKSRIMSEKDVKVLQYKVDQKTTRLLKRFGYRRNALLDLLYKNQAQSQFLHYVNYADRAQALAKYLNLQLPTVEKTKPVMAKVRSEVKQNAFEQRYQLQTGAPNQIFQVKELAPQEAFREVRFEEQTNH